VRERKPSKFLNLEKATMETNIVFYFLYSYWIGLEVTGLHFRKELE